MKDHVTEDQHDKLRWIDTSSMICDPLTKAGTHNFNQRLHECMTTGILNLQPTVESQMRKLARQKLRRKNAEAKAANNEGDEIEDDDLTVVTRW